MTDIHRTFAFNERQLIDAINETRHYHGQLVGDVNHPWIRVTYLWPDGEWGDVCGVSFGRTDGMQTIRIDDGGSTPMIIRADDHDTTPGRVVERMREYVQESFRILFGA